MNKQDAIIPAILGIPCALYTLVIGFSSKTGFIIMLGVGILIVSSLYMFLRNRLFAKIITMLLSIFIIACYLLLLIMLIMNRFHYGWGVALILYFPIFAWSIATLIILFGLLRNIRED